MIWSNGLYVGVGMNGNIFTSPDSITWTERDSGTKSDLYDIDVVNGEYTVVSETSLLHSTDAINWKIKYSQRDLQKVKWLNNQFVAVGYGGIVATSANGSDWQYVSVVDSTAYSDSGYYY